MLVDLVGCGGPISCGPALRQDFAGGKRRAEYEGSRGHMAGGGSVVNQRVTVLRFEELRDVGNTNFQFQRGGYTVERFDPLAGDILAVLMQIDESGSDNKAGAR